MESSERQVARTTSTPSWFWLPAGTEEPAACRVGIASPVMCCMLTWASPYTMSPSSGTCRVSVNKMFRVQLVQLEVVTTMIGLTTRASSHTMSPFGGTCTSQGMSLPGNLKWQWSARRLNAACSSTRNAAAACSSLRCSVLTPAFTLNPASTLHDSQTRFNNITFGRAGFTCSPGLTSMVEPMSTSDALRWTTREAFLHVFKRKIRKANLLAGLDEHGGADAHV